MSLYANENSSVLGTKQNKKRIKRPVLAVVNSLDISQVTSRLSSDRSRKMFTYTVIALILCSALQFSSAVPLPQEDSQSSKESVSDPEAAKEILNNIVEEVQQLVEDTKNAAAENQNAEIVAAVSEKAAEVIKDSQAAIDEISKNEISGGSGSIAGIKGLIGKVASNALQLASDAKTGVVNGVVGVVEGSGNLAHGAIGAVGSATKKVIDTSGRINQGVHNLVGAAISSVSGGAHKAVDIAAAILTWGKAKKSA